MNRLASFVRRNSVNLGVIIITLAFMAILCLQSIAMSRLQDQVAGQQQLINQVKGVTEQINTSSQQRTDQLNTLNRHLDCIVTFFTRTDRTQKAIANINTCTISNEATGSVAVVPVDPPAATAAQPKTSVSQPATQPTTQPTTQTTFLQQFFNPAGSLINRLWSLQ